MLPPLFATVFPCFAPPPAESEGEAPTTGSKTDRPSEKQLREQCKSHERTELLRRMDLYRRAIEIHREAGDEMAVQELESALEKAENDLAALDRTCREGTRKGAMNSNRPDAAPPTHHGRPRSRGTQRNHSQKEKLPANSGPDQEMKNKLEEWIPKFPELEKLFDELLHGEDKFKKIPPYFERDLKQRLKNLQGESLRRNFESIRKMERIQLLLPEGKTGK